MNAEPITSEQRAAIEARLAAGFRTDWGYYAPKDISDLLGEISRLTAELADERATHAKTLDVWRAALGLDDGESLTIWRAEHDGIPLGTYIHVEEALAHCEDVRASTPHPVSWYEDDPADPSEPTTLRLHVDYGDEELDTGYAVVPMPLLAAYDPDGDQ